MPYYLQWPATTGNVLTNNSLLEISGIVGALASVSFTVKGASTGHASSQVLYDIRRTVGSTVSGGGTSYISFWDNQASIGVSGANNLRINGASVTNSQFMFDFVADDVLSFDVGSTPSGGCIAIGARYDQREHWCNLAISEIIITDSNGVHTINMSDSNGIGTSLTSTDAAITATLYNFPGDNSQWVSYGGAPTPQISLSGVYAPSQVITVTPTNFVGTPTQATLTDSAANSMVRVLTPAGNDYTFTLPDLPAPGNNTAGLLFGDITVTVNDPGV